MTIEEKAIAYDEALALMQDCIQDKNGLVHVRPENIFPALKEGEDERIRKRIYNYINVTLDDNESVEKEKWLAWLEKQCEQYDNEDLNILQRFSFYSYKDEPNILYLSGLYVNGKCRNKGIGTKILEVADKVAKSLNCHAIRLKTKKGTNAERLYRTYGYNSLATEERDEIWLEKQVKQKNEPKYYNVGDWIVWQDKSYEVKRNDCGYELIDTNGLSTSLENGTVDENAHHWTFLDAKEGDVLVASDGSIFIFKEVVDNACKHYIALAEDNETIQVNDNLEHCWEVVRGVRPATKVQCDLLFQKMKEAGYEWDEEKKEPKKIEQKDSTEEISGNLREISSNSKWTEEDEKYIDNCCLLIGAADDCYEKTFKDDCIHYLQSLKERIAWKPMPIKQKDIDDLVFDFKWSSENFKNKRVTDIYRQGIYDVMELLKQRMEQ